MSFLDEDELDPAPGGPRRGPADRQRQLLVRRVVAVAVAVVILILLLLAVRGCLNARQERGFENYVSDLETVVTQSTQLSQEFFGRLLEPPKGLSELQLEAQIASDRGTAEGLLERVEGLDTPDELSDAQSELTQAFELRRDGLAGIAEDIPTALSNDGRQDAIKRIVTDMEAFLASDVLYERASAEINDELAAQELGGEIQASQFLPPPAARWLDDIELTTTLNSFAAATGNVPEGIHGVELFSTTIDRTTLTPDVENTVGVGNEAPEITVEVSNGGDTEETDLIVTYSLTGGATPIEGELPIPSIDAGGTTDTTLPLDALPETDVPLTLEVKILPVLGETLIENNTSTYTVIFN